MRTKVVGVSGDAHAWVIVEQARPGRSDDDPDEVVRTLYHLPSDSDPLTVHRAPTRLGSLPVHVSSWGSRLAFAPKRSKNTPDDLIPLRVVEVEAVGSGRYFYGSPAPVEPIASSGSLESLSWSAGRLTVVVRERERGARLLRLVGSAWIETALPSGIDRGARLELVASDSHLLVGEVGTNGGRLWNARAPEAGGGDALLWQSATFATRHTPGLELMACAGQVVTVDNTSSGAVIGLIRGSSHTPVGRLNSGAGVTILAVGDRVAQISVPTDSGGRWEARTLGVDGAVLYEGPIDLAGPIAPGEVQALALLMASVFVSILVFVVRPASTWGAPVALPAGTALADPMRRLAAFSVDLIPGVAAAWLVFGRDATFEQVGVWPLLLMGGVTIVHSTIGEALSGRTLGKLATSCRTISASGDRPSWSQAFLHSAVKVVCPPLAMFVLAAPYATGPASFGTVVVVDVGGEDGDGASGDKQGDEEA